MNEMADLLRVHGWKLMVGCLAVVMILRVIRYRPKPPGRWFDE